MFTDPNHLRVQDPGRVEGNPVFIYLDAFSRPEHFAEFLPEYQNLDELDWECDRIWPGWWLDKSRTFTKRRSSARICAG